jgi:2'-5' RNA ligase
VGGEGWAIRVIFGGAGRPAVLTDGRLEHTYRPDADDAPGPAGLHEGKHVSGHTVNAFVSLRLPPELVEALVDLQTSHETRVQPQQREHMHITVGFLHDADAGRLADAAALLTAGTWPAPELRLTGEVRHGSWQLQKDPAYRYDESVVQKQEQVRLGIAETAELATLYTDITEPLGIAEDGFWPHVTLGLARDDFPVSETEAMELPAHRKAAPYVELQQEVSVTEFRTLTRNALT